MGKHNLYSTSFCLQRALKTWLKRECVRGRKRQSQETEKDYGEGGEDSFYTLLAERLAHMEYDFSLKKDKNVNCGLLTAYIGGIRVCVLSKLTIHLLMFVRVLWTLGYILKQWCPWRYDQKGKEFRVRDNNLESRPWNVRKLSRFKLSHILFDIDDYVCTKFRKFIYTI